MKKRRVEISVFQLLIILLIIIAIVVTIVIVKKNVDFSNLGIKILKEEFVGTGTIDNPYRIEYIEDLVRLSENVNKGKSYKNKYFKVENNLDFKEDKSYKNPNSKFGDINNDGNKDSIKVELTTNSGFKSIGDNESNSFEGIFDGNGKTIKNLIITNKNNAESLVGLFGYNQGKIARVTIVGNITLENKIENEKIYAGMLCARNKGIIETCNIEGIIEEKEIIEKTITKVAGIVAENMGKIVNTVSNVNIISNQLKAGIVAENIILDDIENSAEIINCTNLGNIKENIPSDYYTGGIVAINDNGNITSCNNNGEIEGKKVGGIAGTSKGYIVACQNAGNIRNLEEDSNDEEIAGGIVGTLDSSIVENCKNIGNIEGLTNVGGIVGKNQGTISQCKNVANISKILENKANILNIGGIVGDFSQGKVTNSKNYGSIFSKVDNIVNLGGICGTLYKDSIIESSENHGELAGAGKTIISNEDLNKKCFNCISNNGGTAENADFGELNIGLIYGKYIEK